MTLIFFGDYFENSNGSYILEFMWQ